MLSTQAQVYNAIQAVLRTMLQSSDLSIPRTSVYLVLNSDIRDVELLERVLIGATKDKKALIRANANFWTLTKAGQKLARELATVAGALEAE